MKTLIIILLALTVISSAEELSRHSISASLIPIFPVIIYPDIGYEYAITSRDAIGFSTVLTVINRVTYSRKMGNFCLSGSLGFAAASLDIDKATTFATVAGEHRLSLGDHFYTRAIAGVLFAGDLPENMPCVPLLQIGLGYTF